MVEEGRDLYHACPHIPIAASKEQPCASATVRLKIIGNEIIKHVGKSQSCMVSKLPRQHARGGEREGGPDLTQPRSDRMKHGRNGRNSHGAFEDNR